ncbi:MAG TPA: glycosyltransferase [Solirubrobacteraceae bacterium]|jgi:glycosyltransferase involved in cell wall biosynthesis
MRAIISERYGRRIVRALVVSNMLPDDSHPERGSFVRDQVAALATLPGVEVELYEFAPGARALATAVVSLRRRFGGHGARRRRVGAGAAETASEAAPRFDVVHAHFGLTAWPALAVPARVRALTVHGTDVSHPRTRIATAAVLPSVDLLAAVSAPLIQQLPGRAARRRAQVLPCGVDLRRFRPLPREQARLELGLRPAGPYLLFPADPSRALKRYDRALALADATGAELLVLRSVEPERVAMWVNAANAVLVPSEREGFGLAVLEALACDVPVLATPVGVHPEALRNVAGTLCAPFDPGIWRTALEPFLRAPDPRVEGRASAMPFSSTATAERVVAAWRAVLERSGQLSG